MKADMNRNRGNFRVNSFSPLLGTWVDVFMVKYHYFLRVRALKKRKKYGRVEPVFLLYHRLCKKSTGETHIQE